MNKELKFIKSKGLEKEFAKFKKETFIELETTQDGHIALYINEEFKDIVWYEYNTYQQNITGLVLGIATEMDCLASKEQMLNIKKIGGNLDFHLDKKNVSVINYQNFIRGKEIDTFENAEKIKNLIKNYKPLMKRIFDYE